MRDAPEARKRVRRCPRNQLSSRRKRKVRGLYTHQHRGDDSPQDNRKDHSNGNTNRTQAQALQNNQRKNVTALGSQGHTDANFRCALPSGCGDHTKSGHFQIATDISRLATILPELPIQTAIEDRHFSLIESTASLNRDQVVVNNSRETHEKPRSNLGHLKIAHMIRMA
jgi:hypothetical protein